MSDVKWTAAQQAAIDDRGGSLLVSAAAGSGKTAVLAQRAVQLITDPEHPVDADRLLIVTFTNAAAAELRARIGEKLLAELRKRPGDLRLQRQRMLLQRASICTIDSFCLHLIQQNFQALDIPPDFTTGDAGTLEQLRQAALAETLEQAYQDPDFRALADLYGKSRSDDVMGRLMLGVYSHWRSMPYCTQQLRQLAVTPDWNDPQVYAQQRSRFETVCGVVMARVRELLQAAVMLNEDGEQILLSDQRIDRVTKIDLPADRAEKLRERYSDGCALLQTAGAQLETVLQAAQCGWDALYQALQPWLQDGAAVPGVRGTGLRLPGDRHALVKLQSDQASDYFEEVLGLIGCTEQQAWQEYQQEQVLLAALYRALVCFDELYFRRKLERKVLEFSDFEHLALQLLEPQPGQVSGVCGAIRAGFDAVMVDEYQDTNALQDRLYRCLASPQQDNLFLVGDMKQSIYRFRQADPTIFLEKLDHYAELPVADTARPRPADGQPGTQARLALDANFRSAPAVVGGVNFLFEQLMSRALGGVEYGDGQRLVCGAPGEYTGHAEMQVLKTEAPEDDARFVARRIRELVQDGTPVRDGAGGTRPLEYGDCCILLATRANFQRYAEALQAQGIPVYADSAEDLLDAAHIRPLIALLRVIDNPAQDIYLAAAMLGSMFGFTDDDLVTLRAQQGRISLYGAVLRAAQGQDEFARKVGGFYRTLTQLRQAARTIPVEELLEEIFVTTGYLAALGAMENGARRREDARRFAAFCCANGANGVPGLIRAIDATAAAGGLVDSAAGKGQTGCVTIMTIHRSKGLQFPAVFVADTGHRFNTDDLRRQIVLHPVLGAGMMLRGANGEGGLYPGVSCMAVRQLLADELRSEQMRLLYVALTRAQDILVVTAPYTKPEKALEKAAVFHLAGRSRLLHREATCFADWIVSALMVHPDAHALRELAKVHLPWKDNAPPIGIWYDDLLLDLGPQQQTAETAAPPPDPALVQQLTEGFGWQYPGAALSAVPAKVSVTGVVHNHSDTVLQRPAFLSTGGLTAAEKGTALHSFLQHADFAAFAAVRGKDRAVLLAAVQAESARQVQQQLVEPAVAELLDEQAVVTFVESEAFGRICAADRVLRELAFITALDAGTVMRTQGGAPQGAEDAQVLVQGIADLVLVFPDHLELLDYKTDRGKTEADFVQAYRAQLELYAMAVGRRFAPLPIAYKGIYSLQLGRLIEVK